MNINNTYGNKFDSVIFDLDGTLWDSTPRVVESWNDVIKNYEQIKRPVTKEDLESVFGTKHDLIGKKLFPYLEENLVNEIMDKCYKAENELLSKVGGDLYNNLEEVLAELSKKMPLFIVSNCQEGYIETFLEYHKLAKHFKDFECSGNTGMTKDKNIKLIMDRNNLKNPVYVGDTMGDYNAAKMNELPFVFAKYGFGEVETPDFVIEEFKGMLNIK